MPRPRCCRKIAGSPRCEVFRPVGVPASALQEIVLTLDELEAIRLADLLGKYQEHAAQQMNVSRQTFGRIIEQAHKKVAQALIEGKALRIEGGEVELARVRVFHCGDCNYAWELPLAQGCPRACPSCQSVSVRCESAADCGRRGGRRKCCRKLWENAGDADLSSPPL